MPSKTASKMIPSGFSEMLSVADMTFTPFFLSLNLKSALSVRFRAKRSSFHTTTYSQGRFSLSLIISWK